MDVLVWRSHFDYAGRLLCLADKTPQAADRLSLQIPGVAIHYSFGART